MPTSKRKTISYHRVMKEVLHNDDVLNWPSLYEALGIMEWFEERKVKPDVRYLFMSDRLQQYISSILADKYVTADKKVDHRVPKYRRVTANWDCVTYSPVSMEHGDYLAIDLTEKLKGKIPREYHHYMPSFDRKE